MAPMAGFLPITSLFAGLHILVRALVKIYASAFMPICQDFGVLPAVCLSSMSDVVAGARGALIRGGHKPRQGEIHPRETFIASHLYTVSPSQCRDPHVVAQVMHAKKDPEKDVVFKRKSAVRPSGHP